MKRITPEKSHRILDGHLNDVIDQIKSMPIFIMDGNYVHANIPPADAMLLDQRFHPRLTGLDGNIMGQRTRQATEYAPIAKVWEGLLILQNINILSYQQLQKMLLQALHPYLSGEPYVPQPIMEAAAAHK